MLGFGALGEFALGEGPTQRQGFSGGQWQTPVRKAGLTVAVIATTFAGFIAPPPAQAAIPFSKFSEPPKKTTPAWELPWLFKIPVPQPQTTVFASFSQPLISRVALPDEQPNTLFEVLPPQGPPFTGFAQFTDILRGKLNLALFDQFTFVPTIPPAIDTHDGVYVKKRKKKPYDAALDELETRRKRREAIELAIYGPPVEYKLPELTFPARVVKPDIGDLPQIILKAKLEQAKQIRARLEADDEDDLDQILKDIL